LSVRQFDQIYQQLLLSRPLQLSMDKDIPAEHASLLLPTAIIIRKFTRYTGIHEFLMPATTLCDGILADYAQKSLGYMPDHDQSLDVLSACRYLARRFSNDDHHTEFVESMVLQLFDGTMRLHRLGARQRLLLQAATILHDTGKYINMSKHNIRTYNIIMATELVGLTHRERDMVAWTSRLHSGRIDLDDSGLADLPSEDRMVVAKLAALLRLADALDNGHQQKITELLVQLDDDALTLSITTRQDVTLELWAFEQKGQLFEKLFGYPARIKIKRAII
jgi:exopolyphosphatase/guanosine-5'-triphosphate,3'-diphosphate pyrophosphatase